MIKLDRITRSISASIFSGLTCSMCCLLLQAKCVEQCRDAGKALVAWSGFILLALWAREGEKLTITSGVVLQHLGPLTVAALKTGYSISYWGRKKIVQESDSFSAWLQWQCSVVVVIFKAGKNTSIFMCVVMRGRSSLPRVEETAASSARKGAAVCLSKCFPWNRTGPWKAFYWLFYCKRKP